MANGADGSIVIDTALDSTGFQADSKKLLKAISSVKSQIESLGAKVRSGFSTSGQIANFIAQTEKAQAKVESLRERLEEFGGQTFQTEAYSDLLAEKEKAEKALLKLYDRRGAQEDNGVSENSQAWKRLTIQIQNAEAEVQRYEAALSAMETNGTAFVQGNQTPEYGAALSQLTEMAQQVENYREQASTPPELSGWAQFGQIMRSVGSAVGRVLSAMARAPFTLFSRGVAAATNKLKQFVTQSHKATLSSRGLVKALTSIKTMLVSRVKRMFISAVINGIRESMQTLAQFDKDFNKSMSNIKNASKGLSANLSVSLGGLIRAIEPVVTRIINAISRAISYLNALFAMLGGKSTVTVAKKQMDSYADSAAGAGGAMEELKRQVYGFDELNKRSKDSGGGGGGGMNPGDLFEEVPIESLLPDSLLDMYERIKAAFEAGDWRGIGTIIAEGLNSGMATVDNWITGTLQPMAVTWTGRIAEILNGVVGGVDWYLLGKLLSDGFNTVLQVVNTFLTTFDFSQLGKGLGDLLNGVIYSVDWGLLGETLANKGNAWIHTLDGIAQTIDWRGLGVQISQGVNSLVSSVDWASAASMLSAGAIGLLRGLTTAIQGIDWQQVGEKTAELIKNIDWSGVGKAFLEGIGAALAAIGDFIVGLFSDPISRVGADMDPELKACGADIVGGILVGILEAIANIVVWIWDNVCVPIIDAVKEGFGIHSPSTVMQEFGVNIVEGLLNGIKETWSNITSFFSSAISGIKSTLSSAWSSIKSAASSSWTGIKTSISTAFTSAKTSVTTAATSLKTSLSTAWSSMKTNATQTWTNIKSSISTAVSNLRTDTTNKVNGIRTSVQSAWSSISSAASSAWSGIQSSVSSKWNALKSSMQNTSWYSVGSNICSGIASGINAGWSWLSRTVSSLSRNLLSAAKRALGIRSPSRLFRDEVGQYVSLGMAEGITDTEANVIKAVSDVAKTATDGLENNKIKLGIDGTTSGLDIVADKLSGIASTFHSIVSMLTSMGGLTVPQIAAGSVVPLRTKMYPSDENGAYNAMSDFSSDFEEFMTYNSDLLKEILEVLKKLRLTIDIDTLSKFVYSAQRSAERNYGGA